MEIHELMDKPMTERTVRMYDATLAQVQEHNKQLQNRVKACNIAVAKAADTVDQMEKERDHATENLSEEEHKYRVSHRLVLDLHAALDVRWGDDPFMEIEKLRTSNRNRAAEVLGWAHADACADLDADRDPREKNVPQMLDRMMKDVEMTPEAQPEPEKTKA